MRGVALVYIGVFNAGLFLFLSVYLASIDNKFFVLTALWAVFVSAGTITYGALSTEKEKRAE